MAENTSQEESYSETFSKFKSQKTGRKYLPCSVPLTGDSRAAQLAQAGVETAASIIKLCNIIFLNIEYNIGNGQISDVTWSAHVMGRYLANAIVSDKSK